MGGRPTFVVTLQPQHDGVDEIKALRFVLKRLLRTHGLRCVTLREMPSDVEVARVGGSTIEKAA